MLRFPIICEESKNNEYKERKIGKQSCKEEENPPTFRIIGGIKSEFLNY